MAFFDFLRKLPKENKNNQSEWKPIASFLGVPFGTDYTDFISELLLKGWHIHHIGSSYVSNDASVYNYDSGHLCHKRHDAIGTYADVQDVGLSVIDPSIRCSSYRGVFGVDLTFPSGHFNKYEAQALVDLLNSKYDGYNVSISYEYYFQYDILRIVDNTAKEKVMGKTQILAEEEKERKREMLLRQEMKAVEDAEKKISMLKLD